MSEGKTGDKRKKQWVSGGDNKRHKGALASASTAKGFSGLLVTCDRTRERQAVRDALNILNEAADDHFPKKEEEDIDEKEEEDPTKSLTVQEQLEQEIASLKKDSSKRKTGRFTPLDTNVKGVILIQFLDTNVCPVELVSKIFDQLEKTKEFSSRFIQRMIPLTNIGYANLEEIKTCAQTLLEKHFQDDKSIEYCVEIKRRNCSNLDSMQVINALAALVGEKHKVNLTKPTKVILVEIFCTTYGLSIVDNFHQFKKFNVRSVLDPPVSTKKKQSQVQDQEEDEDV